MPFTDPISKLIVLVPGCKLISLCCGKSDDMLLETEPNKVVSMLKLESVNITPGSIK